MNTKGIFTPEQISDSVNKYWKKYAAEADASTVNKAECKSIVEATVNALGRLGSGHKFNEEKFTSAYKKVDFMGAEKNFKAVVLGLVTTLAKPDDK
tara:strand:+ start:127 stop:414 length:288 start_codon:yes stop_codon:yes gene_type:complete